MRIAETALDVLTINKIAAKNPVTYFMSLPSGSSKLIGSFLRDARSRRRFLFRFMALSGRAAQRNAVPRKFPRWDPPDEREGNVDRQISDISEGHQPAAADFCNKIGT